jgi:hypothetical protein
LATIWSQNRALKHGGYNFAKVDSSIAIGKNKGKYINVYAKW